VVGTPGNFDEKVLATRAVNEGAIGEKNSGAVHEEILVGSKNVRPVPVSSDGRLRSAVSDGCQPRCNRSEKAVQIRASQAVERSDACC
jgi:hypothetical protein